MIKTCIVMTLSIFLTCCATLSDNKKAVFDLILDTVQGSVEIICDIDKHQCEEIISMRDIQYDNSALGLRVEIPSAWNVENLSGINIGIKDQYSTELLASTATTLYAATTLDSAASVDDITITLASGASEVKQGDRLLISENDAGPKEEVEVESYNTSTRVVTLKDSLHFAHSSGADIYGLWATYSLDTSDTDTFELGRHVVVSWYPTGIDQYPITELGQVVKISSVFADLERRFKNIYHREYRQLMNPYDRFDLMAKEAKSQLETTLRLRGLDVSKIMDQEIVVPVLMATIRWLSLVDVDSEKYLDEREIALAERNRLLDELLKSPIWVDMNQDEIKNESEFQDYSQWFTERGL